MILVFLFSLEIYFEKENVINLIVCILLAQVQFSTQMKICALYFVTCVETLLSTMLRIKMRHFHVRLHTLVHFQMTKYTCRRQTFSGNTFSTKRERFTMAHIRRFNQDLGLMDRWNAFLVCFPMKYWDFSVKSKSICHWWSLVRLRFLFPLFLKTCFWWILG